MFSELYYNSYAYTCSQGSSWYTVLEWLPPLVWSSSHLSHVTECMPLILVSFYLSSFNFVLPSLLLPALFNFSICAVACLKAIALQFVTLYSLRTANHKCEYVCPMAWSDFSLPWTDFLSSPSCSETTSSSFLPNVISPSCHTWTGVTFPILHWNYSYPSDPSQMQYFFFLSPFPTSTEVSDLPEQWCPHLYYYLLPPQPQVNRIFFPFSSNSSSGSKRNNLPPVLGWIFPLLVSSLSRFWQEFLLFSAGSKNSDAVCRCKPMFFMTLNNVCKHCNRWAFLLFLCVTVCWIGERADLSSTRRGNFFKVLSILILQDSGFLGQLVLSSIPVLSV